MVLVFIHGSPIALKFDMRRVGYTWFLTLLTIAALQGGCKKNNLDEDFFMAPGKQYDMAVEGGFNTLSVNQFIRLTKPALEPGAVPLPISKASVVVNDGRVDIIYRE